MRWKALLAVIIVLGILGILFMTDVGKRYGEFLRTKVGDFISIITRRGPSGPPFKMVLTVKKESFYGQKYRIANSSFTGSGFYRYMNVGGQVISIGSGEKEKVSVNIKNLNGMLEYTNEGNVRLSGDSTQIKIGDYTLSPETATKVDIEIVPFEFSLTGIEQDSIALPFASGDVKTERGNAPLENSKLDISFFSGDLTLAEDGTTVLAGTASSVTGDDFSFR